MINISKKGKGLCTEIKTSILQYNRDKKHEEKKNEKNEDG